jgi:ribosomal protein S6
MALQYEVFYAVGEKEESQMSQIQEEVKGLVEAAGGTWLAEEMVERRKLAYAIKGETRAVYIAKRFNMPDADERKKTDKEGTISELSRQLELHKGVLRHIIVRAEGLVGRRGEHKAVVIGRGYGVAAAQASQAHADHPSQGLVGRTPDERVEEVMAADGHSRGRGDSRGSIWGAHWRT